MTEFKTASAVLIESFAGKKFCSSHCHIYGGLFTHFNPWYLFFRVGRSEAVIRLEIVCQLIVLFIINMWLDVILNHSSFISVNRNGANVLKVEIEIMKVIVQLKD